jgi:hypothetical protein
MHAKSTRQVREITMTQVGQRYTRESVERALAHHKSIGNIRDWANLGDDGMGAYRVTMSDGQVADLRTLHAAYGCVMGLASASQAYARRTSAVHMTPNEADSVFGLLNDVLKDSNMCGWSTHATKFRGALTALLAAGAGS